MAFTAVFEIIRVTAQLLPVVIEAIKAVESAIPTSAGQQKLEVVRGMLQSSFSAVSGITVTFEQVWPSVQSVIAALVAVFNTNGTFAKKAAPPTPAATH